MVSEVILRVRPAYAVAAGLFMALSVCSYTGLPSTFAAEDTGLELRSRMDVRSALLGRSGAVNGTPVVIKSALRDDGLVVDFSSDARTGEGHLSLTFSGDDGRIIPAVLTQSPTFLSTGQSAYKAHIERQALNDATSNGDETILVMVSAK